MADPVSKRQNQGARFNQGLWQLDRVFERQGNTAERTGLDNFDQNRARIIVCERIGFSDRHGVPHA